MSNNLASRAKPSAPQLRSRKPQPKPRRRRASRKRLAAIPAHVRLVPSRALERMAAMVGAITGVAPLDSVGAGLAEAALLPRGDVAVKGTRHLVIHLLIEAEHYPITRLAEQMPSERKPGYARHHSSLRDNWACGWVLRSAWRPPAPEEDGAAGDEAGADMTDLAAPEPSPEEIERAEAIDGLMGWIAAHWREPLADHAGALGDRARAFRRAFEAARAIYGRASETPFAIALAAAAGARATGLRAHGPVKRADAPVMRVLRAAPAMSGVIETLSCEPAAGGGHYLAFTAPARADQRDGGQMKARELMAKVAGLIAAAGWPAMQRSLARAAEGWRAVVHVAQAAGAGVAAALALALGLCAPSGADSGLYPTSIGARFAT